MTGRGQDEFARFPDFAAKLYGSLTRTKGIQRQHLEIAQELASRIEQGRVLDVGCGPGDLLCELHKLNPALELFGLDISHAMVELARRRLAGTSADIRQGEIRHPGFGGDFFDIVTCTGSFYLWNDPADCLNEVFRILRPGRSAYLYESYRDCDRTAVNAALKANLAAEGFMRRMLAPRFFAKQLRMTYSTEEFAVILRRTKFSVSFSIERLVLAGVPAWLRVTLAKCQDR